MIPSGCSFYQLSTSPHVFLPYPCPTRTERIVHRRRRLPTTADQLRQRTKRFAIRVIRLARTLPREPAVDPLARQVVRSAGGIDINYRGACRARSRLEFIAKLGVVVEEADETEHWLDVLHQSNIRRGSELDWLRDEATQLRAIFSKSHRTARRNYHQSPNKSSNP